MNERASDFWNAHKRSAGGDFTDEAQRTLMRHLDRQQRAAGRTDEYEITVSFLDQGEIMVQVQGKPYPLGLFKERDFDLDRLLREARAAIVNHRGSVTDPSRPPAP